MEPRSYSSLSFETRTALRHKARELFKAGLDTDAVGTKLREEDGVTTRLSTLHSWHLAARTDKPIGKGGRKLGQKNRVKAKEEGEAMGTPDSPAPHSQSQSHNSKAPISTRTSLKKMCAAVHVVINNIGMQSITIHSDGRVETVMDLDI